MECDETPFIQSIHDHTGVEGVLVDTSRVSARDHLDALCADIDRPHLPNALAFRLVSQAAAADGHSTIFTGVGGDEWLGGSLSYIRELFYSGRLVTALGDLWRVQIPARDDGFINRLSWLSPGIGLSRLFGRRRRSVRPMRGIVRPEHLAGTGPIRGSWRERTAGQGISSSKMDMIGSFDRLVAGSVLEILEGQAAQFGVEVRYPLMDLDLIEFGFSLESRALVEGRCHKSLLRRTMEDRLPADVTGRIETTVFAVLFTREFEDLGQLPAGAEWDLSRLGTVRASAIDACLAEPYSESTRCDLIWLWWLESFVRRRFRQDIQVGSIRVEEDDDGGQ